MRILIISSYWEPYCSGALTLVGDVAAHWAAAGHAVQVLTFRYAPRLASQECLRGVHVRRLGGFVRVSKGFVAPLLLSRAWQAVRQADVVLLNLPCFEGVRLALAARALGRPVIALLNCAVELGPHWHERLVQRALESSVRLQLRLAQHVVVWSADYAHHCPWLRGVAWTEIRPGVAPPPIDTSFAAHLRAQLGDRRAIGFAGRVAREKGLDVLVEALQRLPEPRPVLLMAGPRGSDVVGEGSADRALDANLTAAGLEHLHLGLLARAELGAFYSVLDCLVLPSTNRTESFGLVQIEALQLGVPVVASDLPGVRDPLRLCPRGRLAVPGDPDSLADAIGASLTLPPADATMRSRAADCFAAAPMLQQWDALLATTRAHGGT